MLRIIGMVLAVLVLVALVCLGSIYVYLSPEGQASRSPDQATARSIKAGSIIGYAEKHSTQAWLGIPFAAPPVGEQRWRPPGAVIPWQGQREMLEFGDSCVQFTQESTKSNPVTEGSEDCLTLNVYAPDSAMSKAKSGAPLPVMFWIHGGGNTIGSGSDSPYNGALLAASQDVIVVTTNYRLGPLGWFTHSAQRVLAESPEDSSGNFGTLDLIAGLTWVKGNIAAFGGDPGNVTIFGESAGGFNVMALMVSPLARDLFHRAIVQSGGLILASMASAEQPSLNQRGTAAMTSREVIARLLLKEGRAPSREAALARQDEMPAHELMAWLREMPSETLYSVMLDGPTFAGMFDAPDNIKDGFVLPILTDDEILSDPANYARVPLMTGTNRDENKLFMGFNPDYVNTSLGGILPTRIKDLEAYNRDSRFGSDLWWGRGVDRLAQAMSQHDPGNIYAYRFDADDWRDLGWLGLPDLGELLGAAHALEVLFVFGYFDGMLKLIFPAAPELRQLSADIMDYWGAFAKKGSPGRGTSGQLPNWQPWSHGSGSSHILLDTSLDGGIRMQDERFATEDIKAQMMVELSRLPLEKRCFSYSMTAWGSDFDEQEYALLGCADD